MQSDARMGNLLYLSLAAIGAWAGISGWWLSEGWQDGMLPEREMLGLSFGSFAFFAMVLSLIGPVSLPRALLPAAGTAAVLGGALWWAADRHTEVSGFMELGYPMLAFSFALLIVTPFVASALCQPRGWQDYPTLYRLSWRIAVRHVAAFVFTAMFWGIFALSDAVLSIVGLDLWDVILRQDVTAWALSGAVFGVALAVVHELREFISPYLVLRLLRLFVPVVLVVAVIFVIALPIQGWGGLLNGWSPAAALMAFSLAAVVLVTISVDCEVADETNNRLSRALVALLAVLVPVLAGLGLWAVWLRVGQYGWTPERLMAATIAVVLVAYGLAYAGAVALRQHWMARIRQANIWLALGVVALCLLWLTPVLSPETIAARSQLSRAVAGGTAEELPLWEMSQDWGRAGQAALVALAEARPELARAIDEAKPSNRYTLDAPVPSLFGRVPVYPAGVELPATAFDDLPDSFVRRISLACDRALPSGPGCGLYVIPSETWQVNVLLFFRVAENLVRVEPLHLVNGVLVQDGRVGRLDPDGNPFDDASLEALHQGEARPARREIEVIELQGRTLFMHN